MFGEFYAGSNLLMWPLIGLGIFVVAFIAVLLYVLVVVRDRHKLDRLAALPLEDDDGYPTTEGESENDR